MKTKLLAGCAIACAALVTSGCASMSAVTGSTGSTSGLSAADLLAVQKEANRHIETCHRTYAWPFAVMIDCAAAAPVTQAITAADVQAMVASAVAKLSQPAAAKP